MRSFRICHNTTPPLPLGMVVAVALAVLSGCGPEPLPRTVYEFEQDRAALDAKLLECFADSRMLRTDLECKNARLAAGKIARDEQAERQRIHEKASQQKLDALRRQREATDAVERQRREDLIALAERKVESGIALTEQEARALGLDPDTSVLSEGNELLPGSDSAVAQLPEDDTERDAGEDGDN